MTMLPRGVVALCGTFALCGVMFPRPGAAQEHAAGISAGTLVIIGGALRLDNSDVWTRVVEAAGGRGSRIAVLPLASSNPDRAGTSVSNALKTYGVEPFVVPRDADESWLQQVASADGVYFTGGQQGRIVDALLQQDGRGTPLLEAIWSLYRRGGMIAGSSAGAAVMSRIMFRDARWVLRTLTDGVKMGREIDRGLGFLPADWLVDQHAIARGRFARSLVAMSDQGIPYGLGVDENTAVVVRPHGPEESRAEVVGQQGAVFLDGSRATRDTNVKEFNLKNVRLSYLDRGDSINLRTKEVRPAPIKLQDLKIDPNSPTFKPAKYEQPPFMNDILARKALVDVMVRVIDGPEPEAIGLAFNGQDAMRESVQGFEFRFYRGRDTVGWYTGADGAESYTVLNVYLDVRPVQLSGPLYK